MIDITEKETRERVRIRVPPKLPACYNPLMRKLNCTVVVACILAWASVAQAQYVLVLKNGRQITVQSYREDGSMIKFSGLGGEIGLPKDQIRTILKPGQTSPKGLNMSELETPSSQPAAGPKQPQTSVASDAPARPQVVDEPAPSTSVDEAKEYRKRLAELTQKLETANREYFEATQGGGTGSNVTNEGMRSWAMDLASRIHDSQKIPGGGGQSSTPPTPPYAPVYTAKEKQLSELRAEIDRLQKERDALLQEMKSKNIPTG